MNCYRHPHAASVYCCAKCGIGMCNDCFDSAIYKWNENKVCHNCEMELFTTEKNEVLNQKTKLVGDIKFKLIMIVAWILMIYVGSVIKSNSASIIGFISSFHTISDDSYVYEIIRNAPFICPAICTIICFFRYIIKFLFGMLFSGKSDSEKIEEAVYTVSGEYLLYLFGKLIGLVFKIVIIGILFYIVVFAMPILALISIIINYIKIRSLKKEENRLSQIEPLVIKE